ncbi:DNA modification methylase [Microbacterium sp. MC2]
MKKSRVLASVALGAALALGASGCSMMAPQATTIPYSPGDGVNIPPSGPLDVLNALVVADDEGTNGNLLAAVVNDTDETQTLTIGVGGTTHTVRVAADTVMSFGYDGVEPLLLEGIDTKPGANLDMTFQSGDGTGVEMAVPVLDGRLDYLAEFVPAS